MPVEVKGRLYWTGSELAQELKLSRQTLWRWRQERKIPVGNRLRSRHILFDEDEVQAIRDYANRLEPADPDAPRQLRLFRRSNRRTREHE